MHESTGSGEYSAARGGTVVGVNLSEAEARSLLGAARVARLATAGEGGRPAQLYRKGTATVLHPPMLRP